MKCETIEKELNQIMMDLHGSCATPYLIFKKFKNKFPQLASQIETEYGNKSGKGSRPYTPALFIAQALNWMRDNGHPLFKDTIHSEDLIDGVEAGNKETISIWKLTI